MQPKPVNCHPASTAWAVTKLKIACYRLGRTFVRELRLDHLCYWLLDRLTAILPK